MCRRCREVDKWPLAGLMGARRVGGSETKPGPIPLIHRPAEALPNIFVIGIRDWLDALDGGDFWDSSSIDPIGLGHSAPQSGSFGRTFCDIPTSQSTASGRILWCVREYLHGSCRIACSACRNRGQKIVGCSATGSLDRFSRHR
jgi:hypothetical protein